MKKMTPEELEQFIHRELRALPPRPAPEGFAARLRAAVAARVVQPVLSPEQLEQLVSRELRALPLRRAPRTLESRVRTAIGHQAAIAWYHRSWSHWPAAARATFLAVGTGVTAAGVTAFFFMTRGVDATAVTADAGSRFGFLTQFYRVGSWTVEFAGHLLGNIPSLWLYGGLATVMALYATFFGLGAAAYRNLYVRK